MQKKYDIGDIVDIINGDFSSLDNEDVAKLCSMLNYNIDKYAGLKEYVKNCSYILYTENIDNGNNTEIEVENGDDYKQITKDYWQNLKSEENCDNHRFSYCWEVKNLNNKIIEAGGGWIEV